MRPELRRWIEGKGLMSAVFRALALWEYSTEEQARQQLVKVIERGNHPPGPYILQYAINRRKQEIQWPFLYIPAIIHLLVSINLTNVLLKNGFVQVFFLLFIGLHYLRQLKI